MRSEGGKVCLNPWEETMKLSPIACLALVASLATVAPAAAQTLGLGKPITYIIDLTKPNAEKVCTDAGGTVNIKADGTKTCTLPPGKLPPPGALREPSN
jgi:hypothetical protein